MECAFCSNEISDDQFFTSRDTQNCLIHNKCLLDMLPHPAFLGGKNWTEEKIDNFIEKIIAAKLEYNRAKNEP